MCCVVGVWGFWCCLAVVEVGMLVSGSAAGFDAEVLFETTLVGGVDLEEERKKEKERKEGGYGVGR